MDFFISVNDMKLFDGSVLAITKLDGTIKNKTMLFLFYNKSMLALNKDRVVNVKNGMVIDKFETFFPSLGHF